MWGRGLKLIVTNHDGQSLVVAPHVGAWIETAVEVQFGVTDDVAPHVGAWIETARASSGITRYAVAPHVGAWIETRKIPIVTVQSARRPPCGGVD